MEKDLKLILKTAMIVLFALCLLKMPYGYYQLVRFVGMFGFAVLAYLDGAKELRPISIFWIASALLSNPFVKIALGRKIWNLVDICWILFLIVTILIDLKSSQKKNAS